MKWSSIALVAILLVSQKSIFAYWPETMQDHVTRKSWRFDLDSTAPSVLNKYHFPKTIDIPACVDGTSECLHAKNQFMKYVTKLAEKSLMEENDGLNITSKGAWIQKHTEKMKNQYHLEAPKKFHSKDKKLNSTSKIPDTREQIQPTPISIDANATENTEGRIIAYKLNRTMIQMPPSTATVPTVTLGQLARQVIFPDWLWTRFATNRKIGSGLVTTNVTRVLPSATTASPVKLPTVTFDNNFSRFMKLFTLVRFQNTPCVSSSGRNGTCYHSRECTELGGTASNSCASGFGVCCVFENTCGETTSTNGTYFVDNGAGFKANAVNTCTLQVLKTTPNIKEMRLDFHVFSLQQPNAGNCELDRFVISGQNTNNVIPILCGENNNTHLYVETEGSSTSIQLSIMTTGEGFRTWSIRITQFEVTNPSTAPTNCLQYHIGITGSIRSFNYVSPTSPQYLNNLNYAICIRKEAGFCSVTFTNSGPDGTYMPFQVVNANDNGHLVIPSGQAGVGVRDCPFDFLLINGYRLCGERLNDATTNVLFVEDAPVTDTSNGPFIVTVRTNELDVGGGFFLYYRQNPCMSSTG